ncbi:MAG: hypothetical protein K5864_03625 [Bacteroidales bacterium]|nr:hypothetical protein [Bacteroidales bacterium]
MNKKTTILLFFILLLTISRAQQYSGAPAIARIKIEGDEPILTVRGIRNYNIYRMTVDTVMMINVCKEFYEEFNEQYIMSCNYLSVCLDSSKYYHPKSDWITNKEYIIEVDVGWGIGDLSYYKMGLSTNYIPDPYSIATCSWGVCPYGLKGAFLEAMPDGADVP